MGYWRCSLVPPWLPHTMKILSSWTKVKEDSFTSTPPPPPPPSSFSEPSSTLSTSEASSPHPPAPTATTNVMVRTTETITDKLGQVTMVMTSMLSTFSMDLHAPG